MEYLAQAVHLVQADLVVRLVQAAHLAQVVHQAHQVQVAAMVLMGVMAIADRLEREFRLVESPIRC